MLQPRNFAYICSRRPPEWRNGRRAGPILCWWLGRPQTPCGLPPFRIFPLRFKIHGSAGSLVRTSSSAVAAGIRKICIFAAIACPSGGMVDALDSKSCVLKRRVGSIPTSGTKRLCKLLISRYFTKSCFYYSTFLVTFWSPDEGNINKKRQIRHHLPPRHRHHRLPLHPLTTNARPRRQTSPQTASSLFTYRRFPP